MPAVISKAPGKIILFGEHAVVYGYPAIAVPIDAVQTVVTVLPVIKEKESLIHIRNMDWKEDNTFNTLAYDNPIKVPIEQLMLRIKGKPPLFDMTISSTIPIAAGLGSSAALAVAITKAFSQFLGFELSSEQINELALQSEKIQHGSPSGIDNSVITYGKPIYFRKNLPIIQIEIPKPLKILLADTGERTLTKDAVNKVKHRMDDEPSAINLLLSEIGEITDIAWAELQAGHTQKIGNLMSRNHTLLNALGVSSAKLDRLVNSALMNGALGAKLCGGGMGGYMAGLCESDTLSEVKSGLESDGAEFIIETIIGKSI